MNLYVNFWPGFKKEDFLMEMLFRNSKKNLIIVGPFQNGNVFFDRIRLLIFFLKNQGKLKADFFVTGENKPPQFNLAKKQIGFWRSYAGRSDVFRFPYWMWHLDWPELVEIPKYPRYGIPLSIDRLMRPIRDTYDIDQIKSRFNRAVLFSGHLQEPRKRFFRLTESILGCDGFGGAFGEDDRRKPKMPVMEGYKFSLCPENSIGDGYITEKIPEAFNSGCVPITWCHPDDLLEDFNPKAVINLYGLDDYEIKNVLIEVASEGHLYQCLINEPLLLSRPSLHPLLAFISESPRAN